MLDECFRGPYFNDCRQAEKGETYGRAVTTRLTVEMVKNNVSVWPSVPVRCVSAGFITNVVLFLVNHCSWRAVPTTNVPLTGPRIRGTFDRHADRRSAVAQTCIFSFQLLHFLRFHRIMVKFARAQQLRNF